MNDMMAKQFHSRIKGGGDTLLIENGELRLSWLDIELTERCNQNCLHCCINLPADDRDALSTELSSAKIMEILREAAALGCLTVRMTGGEPLLREDFEDLYVFARRLGLRIKLFTNATLITPRMAGLFQRIPPLENVEVSLYGISRESHDEATRTPGAFQAAMRGINCLRDNKIPFVVKSALLPPNKQDIDRMQAWAETIPWMNGPMTFSRHFILRCRRDSVRKNRLIESLRISPQENFSCMLNNRNYVANMKSFVSCFLGPQGNRLFFCLTGKTGCVDAYGLFQPCMLCKHPQTSYDLKRGSLEKALKEFLPEIMTMEAHNEEYATRCGRCFLRGLCEQCPAKSWTEHGTLDTPVEYFCQLAQETARRLGLIEANEKSWEILSWQDRIKNFVGDKPNP